MAEREPPRRRSLEAIPTPDFDNPITFDGYPTTEDTELIGDLQRMVRNVQAWATAAYVTRPDANATAELATLLTDTSNNLRAYAVKLVR